MMKHSMKLRLMLALSMLIQPLYAGQKIDNTIKAAKVVVHTVTLSIGVWFLFLGQKKIAELAKEYWNYLGNSNKTIPLRKRENTRENFFSGTMLCAGSLPLLYSGVSGINRELQLRRRAKQFFDRVMRNVRTTSKK